MSQVLKNEPRREKEMIVANKLVKKGHFIW